MRREPSLSVKTADVCNNSYWAIRPIEVMGLIEGYGYHQRENTGSRLFIEVMLNVD